MRQAAALALRAYVMPGPCSPKRLDAQRLCEPRIGLVMLVGDRVEAEPGVAGTEPTAPMGRFTRRGVFAFVGGRRAALGHGRPDPCLRLDGSVAWQDRG
jgi:hypothetical protein